MGKNLRGREIGKGLCQRKDGLYVARFINRLGKRAERSFSSLPLARNWLEDARHADKHAALNHTFVPSEITVDEWFEFWISHIVGDLAPNTLRNYRERFQRNIHPVLGHLKLADVKPLHCKMVLSGMNEDYSGSTIRQTYITMGTFFKAALMNDLITKHPMDGVRYTKPVRAVSDIRFLTIDEQERFLEVANRSHNYYQYALILETGLRIGELIGLTWDNISWANRTLTVTKTLEYRHSQGIWRAGPPKTLQSYRTIPLTQKAHSILKTVAEQAKERKESDELSQTLEYMDRRTGETVTFQMRDLVFINFRTGMPSKNSSYDTHLYKLCDEAGIKRFSAHVLRHTYATRAIERDVPPKVLQKLLGHSNLSTTMDRYVHVTSDSMALAIQRFEGSAPPNLVEAETSSS